MAERLSLFYYLIILATFTNFGYTVKMDAQRVLIVEDDQDLAQLLRMHLQDIGLEVYQERDGLKGCQLAISGGWALMILDISLPSLDGLEICKRVRSHPPYLPILMLTARSSEIDRVVGLEIGADDYLIKPFSVPELLARVKAILRRADAMRSEQILLPAIITHRDLMIDTRKRSVTCRGELVHLTPKEYDLLLLLSTHPGHVYTRAELLDIVWGAGYEGFEHTINSHINRLRSKIEKDPNHPEYIVTLWGVGYKFSDAIVRAETGDTGA